MTLPPEDLACPDPGGCPVAAALPVDLLHCMTLPAGTPMWRCYDGNDGWPTANAGHGDTRFAPFDDAAGRRVPTMYVAASDVAALLETALHHVDHTVPCQVVNSDMLLGRLLAQLATPVELRLADLRDSELPRLGFDRQQVVSSPAEHYPCTRRLAKQVHGALVQGQPVDGVLWQSRQAELASRTAAGPGLVSASATVAVLFCDRVPHGRETWPLNRPALLNLLEGAGRALLDGIADQLNVTIVE